MSFYVTISSEGGKGEVEEHTMHKYKLMSGFIVHHAVEYVLHRAILLGNYGN